MVAGPGMMCRVGEGGKAGDVESSSLQPRALNTLEHIPPRPLPLVQTQAPTPLQTPPSPHRVYDLQDSLDKLMHFLPQLSDFVPLRNGFYSFREQTD